MSHPSLTTLNQMSHQMMMFLEFCHIQIKSTTYVDHIDNEIFPQVEIKKINPFYKVGYK